MSLSDWPTYVYIPQSHINAVPGMYINMYMKRDLIIQAKNRALNEREANH